MGFIRYGGRLYWQFISGEVVDVGEVLSGCDVVYGMNYAHRVNQFVDGLPDWLNSDEVRYRCMVCGVVCRGYEVMGYYSGVDEDGLVCPFCYSEGALRRV